MEFLVGLHVIGCRIGLWISVRRGEASFRAQSWTATAIFVEIVVVIMIVASVRISKRQVRVHGPGRMLLATYNRSIIVLI